MTINFNNVRKRALFRYDDLVKQLNAAKLKDTQYAKPNDVHHGQEININGYILIDAEDLEEVMNDLRMLIGTIASTYEDNDPDFADVFSEAFPEGTEVSIFNEEMDI